MIADGAEERRKEAEGRHEKKEEKLSCL